MERNRPKKQSELTVLTRAKELSKYVTNATLKSPKVFRMTYVARLQNMALETMRLLFKANTYVLSKGSPEDCTERLKCQRQAYTELQLLGTMLFAANEVGCITNKQLEQSTKLQAETIRLLHNWKESDLRRLGNGEVLE